MKIMFCYDGSEISHKALEKTLEYFGPMKPEIMIMSVAEQPLDASMENEEIFEEWKRKRHFEVREEADWVADRGFEVDVVLAVGDAREMIIETIARKNPDLVVIGRRGISEMKRMILGSVSAYIVRHAERPVLVMTLKRS